MDCEYYEDCGLRKITHFIRYEEKLKVFESDYCLGDGHAVAQCPHRIVLIRIKNLERELQIQKNISSHLVSALPQPMKLDDKYLE